MYKEYDLLNGYGRAMEEDAETEEDPYYGESEPEKSSSQAEGYEQVFDLAVALQPSDLTAKRT